MAPSRSGRVPKRPSGGSQARRSKRNAKAAAAKKFAPATGGSNDGGGAPRYTAQNPPPGWAPEPLDPPCENCIRGLISGKRDAMRCVSVYGLSNRCRSCFDGGHACDPCRAALAPLAQRYIVAAQYLDENIPFEDEEDPNNPFVWSDDDVREWKFEKRLKPCMRMVLDLLDEDEDVNNYFEPSAYITAAQGAAGSGSGAQGASVGAAISQLVSQQVQQAMQGNPQP